MSQPVSQNTECIIEGKKTYDNGAVSLRMRMLRSDRPMVLTNELPNILHSLKSSGMLDEGLSHQGFDYTLDFPMKELNQFPYVLDFVMK